MSAAVWMLDHVWYLGPVHILWVSICAAVLLNLGQTIWDDLSTWRWEQQLAEYERAHRQGMWIDP